MAKKNGAAASSSSAVPRKSMLDPGTGSTRTRTRFIVLYGPPGTGKTTACSVIPNAKWIATDSNCIPALQALDRLPSNEDIYELKSLVEVKEWCTKAVSVAKEHGAEALGCSAVVFDSITQLSDWHKEDVATATGQTFLGESKPGEGYQKFNSEFGGLVDALASLSRYVTVIVIGHSKEKPPDNARSQWAGINLSPDAAFKLSFKANWVIRSFARSFIVVKGTAGSEFVTIKETDSDVWEAMERGIYLAPRDGWMTKINAKSIDVTKEDKVLPDMFKLLEREGLLL